jgi:hypothetical protein
MTTFDEREKEFEARFKHDQELQFKVKARRNKLFGLWAAEQMALRGGEADAYAASVVAAQFGGGDGKIVEKVTTDLGAKRPGVTQGQIRAQFERLGEEAKQQVMQV